MAGKHRRRSRRARKFTAFGAATATATALTVGATPLSEDGDARKAIDTDVDLAAAINPFPQPGDIPDLTGGLGSAVYDFGQLGADTLIRFFVENFNLAALAAAAGLDPESVIDNLLEGLLGDLPGPLLQDILDEIPIDVSQLVDELLGPVLGITLGTALEEALALVGADSVGGVLKLLGIDLSDPLNLSNLDVPGVTVLTAGPAFTLLKLLGVDIGWVPSLPNSVADEIINSDYLDVSTRGLVQEVLDLLPDGPVATPLKAVLETALPLLPQVEVLDVRVPVTVGVGLGAFAAATAYDKVVRDLPNQPGGTASSSNPLLGSFTVLPMVLLFNPARPNGGVLARAYPLFSLLGIDTVNPDTEVTSDGGIPILQTGLALGGANLIPILLDIGMEYHPSSDFAAWPNPVTLANNLAALVLPTYILRGIDASRLDEQITTQVGDILADILAGNPLALNLYLTLPANTLPVLEPLYLASDLLNLATLGALPVNPFNLVANAFAPMLTSLTNLGYTDVVFNPDTGAYERTLTEAGVPTPFLSLPDINWGQVPFVLFNQLLAGIEKEFLSGNPTPGTPNAITGLLDLLLGLGPLGDVLGGLGLENLVGDILGDLNLPGLTQQQGTLLAAATPEATSVPSPDARMVPMSADPQLLDQGTKTLGAQNNKQVDNDLETDLDKDLDADGDEDLEEDITDDSLDDELDIDDDLDIDDGFDIDDDDLDDDDSEVTSPTSTGTPSPPQSSNQVSANDDSVDGDTTGGDGPSGQNTGGSNAK